MSLAGAKEIIVDAPVVGGFLRAARDFNIERRARSSTEGFFSLEQMILLHLLSGGSVLSKAQAADCRVV